jgi:tetratricopeptide (TPR) repeat protein
VGLSCPVCRSSVPAGEKFCGTCRADLSLLSAVHMDAHVLLEKADALRAEGQLAPAVQAYLDVLDVDPTNAEARVALGPVLRALRAPRPASDIAWLLAAGAAIALAAFAAGCWFGH